MTNLDDGVAQRYAQAVEHYTTLTTAFARGSAADLSATLSNWFKSSVVGHGGFAEALGFPGAEAIAAQERISRRLMELALDCQRFQSQLSLHWAAVAQATAERFTTQNVTSPPPEDADAWAREMYGRWIEAAERAYTEAAHSSDYGGLIAKLCNAASEFRAEQAALMELWARHFNQPTRSEIDALHQQIKELREQVRGLRKQAAHKA